MLYSVSWSEDTFIKSWSSHSLIKTFLIVYGVNEFIIKTKKYSIYGSRFISPKKRYDVEFYRLVSCFLRRSQVIKFYKKLCVNLEGVNKSNLKKKASRSQFNFEHHVLPDQSFNKMISESFHVFGELPKNADE